MTIIKISFLAMGNSKSNISLLCLSVNLGKRADADKLDFSLSLLGFVVENEWLLDLSLPLPSEVPADSDPDSSESELLELDAFGSFFESLFVVPSLSPLNFLVVESVIPSFTFLKNPLKLEFYVQVLLEN